MTTETLLPTLPLRVRLRNAAAVLQMVAVTFVRESRKRAIPVVGHIREHAYSILGLGFIDAAAFVHSLFTGLLVTGITFLVFEWKVSE